MNCLTIFVRLLWALFSLYFVDSLWRLSSNMLWFLVIHTHTNTRMYLCGGKVGSGIGSVKGFHLEWLVMSKLFPWRPLNARMQRSFGWGAYIFIAKNPLMFLSGVWMM